MAYLVTGGTGYLGSYTVRDLLNAGKEVVCLQRSGVTPLFREVVGEQNLDKVRIVRGDVSDIKQLLEAIQANDVDLIVHIGYLIPPASETQPAYAVQVNSVGMNNVLEAVRLLGLKRVVWSSSAREFGTLGRLYKEPIRDDEAIYMPNSMYSATKTLNEFMAKLYFQKFGVDSIGIRLGRVFGVGKLGRGEGGQVFTEFLRKAALNIPASITDADIPVGLIYIEDASDLMVRACEAPTTKTRVFNAIEGEYTHRQVADVVRKINPKSQLVVEEKVVLSRDFEAPPLDTTGLRTELRWQPKHSLEDGLRKVMNYFRQREGLPAL